MKTWTITEPVIAVVSADTVELAITLLEKELQRIGISQTIKPEQFIPMPTQSRKVRILFDGGY